MLPTRLLQALLNRLMQPGPLALALILARQGSGPREVGARMLVDAGGRVAGSLGGGALELAVIERAREALAEGAGSCLRIDLNGTPDAPGMLCGGRMEVLIQVIDPAEPGWRALYQALSDPPRPAGRAWLITRLPEPAGQWLVREDGSLQGVGPLGREQAMALVGHAGRLPVRHQDQAGTFLIEPVMAPARLLIFGAGHVARHLARLAADTEFSVWVLDDRAEFVTPERFPLARRLICLDRYEHALTGIELDQDSYLAILTQGHAGDLAVLRQVLDQDRAQDAGYLGMIGSRRKWARLQDQLRHEGFDSADLARVHCPIGLAIGAETPVEIAISILAELIQVRAARAQHDTRNP
jgi:xanthine dehydrogenase accessory factor